MSEVTHRRYYLPSIKGEGWAVIFIDSRGIFSAVSDYGNYGYPCHPEPDPVVERLEDPFR